MDIEREISRLNPRQQEAVYHTKGPLLILAGAGSGKTRVITMRTAYLLHGGAAPSSVLAVTFTNKAAREMRERVSSMLSVKGGPVISTFHSLCLNILRKDIDRLGYRKDFSIYDTGEQLSVVRNIMSDIRFYDKSFKAEALLEKISLAKNGCPAVAYGKAVSQNPDLDEAAERIYPKYEEILKTLNALDFDDLLLLTLKLFRENPDVLEKYRDRFRYIMVDEYQDTNRVQYDFIKLLSGERKNICVVGDDDQSIYGWRGADIANVLDFEKDFPGALVIKLEQNYRSTGNILHVANSVIKNNKKRMAKTLWSAGKPGPKVQIFKAIDGEDEASWVADKIFTLRAEKNLPYDAFAVIYRANLFSKPFEEELRKLRIPYTVVGGTSYFERREVKDLTSYLKIIANPSDDLSLLRAANIPKRGLGTTALGKIAEHAKAGSISMFEAFSSAKKIEGLGEKPASAASGFAELLDRYRTDFMKKGTMAETFRKLSEEICYKEHIRELYKTPEVAAKKIENIEGFISSLGRYETSEPSPSLTGFLETMALTDMLEEKEEREKSGVTLISIHSSKGLEFPVVFISGVEEDILPHKKSVDASNSIEEERRLFYVGVTRAMRELYITHTGHRIKYGKQAPSSPSRFLDELPEEAITRADGTAAMAPEEEEDYARKSFAKIKALLGD